MYQKLGFKVSREFNYFIQDLMDVKLVAKHSSCNYLIQSIDLSWKEMMIGCWDFIPSWQNSFEAIARNPKDFKMEGFFDEGKLIGYYIFEPKSGDITQLAVHPEYRRKGLASVLLNRAVSFTQIGLVKAINTLVGCESVTEFLQANGIPLKGKQFEMIKPF